MYIPHQKVKHKAYKLIWFIIVVAVVFMEYIQLITMTFISLFKFISKCIILK